MSTKLAILAWSVSADAPDLCAAPFVYAAAAAALDCEVEIHFAGGAVELLRAGVAERALTAGGRSIYDFIQDAAAAGVKLFACSMAAAPLRSEGVAMIPEFTAYAGATAFALRAVADDWRTLVF